MASTMIIFNGIDLQNVAGVKIEDVRVSGIEYQQVTRGRSVSAGSLFIRNRAASRTVTVTFALLKQDRVSRQAALDAVKAWAKTDKEYKLELVGHPDRYLMAVCTEHPSPSLRQWWEPKLRLVFSCYDDPYWNATNEKTANCGTAFLVMGNVPPRMRIERTLNASASNQSYALDGNTVTFSTIPAGDMVIDLNNQTAKVGSNSIMQYYNVNSRWLIPRIGSQTITGTGTVKYREKFE